MDLLRPAMNRLGGCSGPRPSLSCLHVLGTRLVTSPPLSCLPRHVTYGPARPQPGPAPVLSDRRRSEGHGARRRVGGGPAVVAVREQQPGAVASSGATQAGPFRVIRTRRGARDGLGHPRRETRNLRQSGPWRRPGAGARLGWLGPSDDRLG